MRLLPGQHNSSTLTGGALFLILCGLFLAFQDVQWQLISMASFHAGIALTAVALLIHALRRHRAWRLELLVLAALGLLLMLAPALPLPFQDFLEYLIP
tara:strand:- start:2742 stop:3035 length:294 start_codon:yes stop_codon:yes gene_type:complete